MPSRRRRRPFRAVSDDCSAGSSIISSQRRHNGVQEYANVVLMQAESDAFLVQGNTKTPKMSNRGRSDAQLSRSSHVSHVFRHITGRSWNESLQVVQEPVIHPQHQIVPSNTVEALDSSKASESIRVILPSEDKNAIFQPTYQCLDRLDREQQAPHERIEYNETIAMSKAKRVKRVSVDEECGHQSMRRQACNSDLRERNLCPAQLDRRASPETLDSMDCSSGESLDMDLSREFFARKGHASPCSTNEHGSFTSSRLGKLRKSKVDNPAVVAAMFASFPSPRMPPEFPLGCTIGGEEFDEFESLDGSEITMRTMEKLEMGSKKTRFPSQLIRSHTDPSNFVEKKYFEAEETMISGATRAARDKCLSILNGARRSLAATTFPPDEDRHTNNANLTIDAADEDNEAGQCNEDVTPQRYHSPQKFVPSNKCAVKSKTASTIIRLDRLPEPSTNQVMFEYNGEIFQHAPLPSGWEVRISKSKNRPFYTHPDRGATWYCPVVNPIGASESASLSIVPSSVKEKMGAKLSRTRGHESTNDFDNDSLNSSASDAEGSHASTGSSGLSVGSMDEVSAENIPYIKAGKGAKGQDRITRMIRTSPEEGISNVVKRSVTVEHDDLKSYPSDMTDAKPERGAVGCLANRSDASIALRVSKSNGNDDELDNVPQNSPREEIHLNCTSPDEEIVSLVLVNLAHRQARAKGRTLELYPSDRIDTSSQLSAMAGFGILHYEGATQSNQAIYVPHESPPIYNRVISLFHSPDKLLLDQMEGSHDDCDVVAANCNSQNVGADDDFPTTVDDDVQSGDDQASARLEQGSEVRQQKSTTVDADMQVIRRHREVAFDVSSHDSTFHDANGASDASADDQNESDGNIEDVGHDYPYGTKKSPVRAKASVAVSDKEVTDSWSEDSVCLASNARNDFHPNVVATNSVCSVSTLGGYKPTSCAGGTFSSKMSFRILNPPHPICALQTLDHMQLIAERNQKLKRIKARQFGGPKSYEKCSVGPARRLNFLDAL